MKKEEETGHEKQEVFLGITSLGKDFNAIQALVCERKRGRREHKAETREKFCRSRPRMRRKWWIFIMRGNRAHIISCPFLVSCFPFSFKWGNIEQ